MAQIHLRPPIDSDGLPLNRLIGSCPPLDTNSVYCNLLQCTHFADTSIIAETNVAETNVAGTNVVEENAAENRAAEAHSSETQAELLGFISAYVIPNRPNTLFIWQVAVSELARGQGLAIRMLKQLLNRENLRQVQFLETTITPENTASWAMMERFAQVCDSPLVKQPFFDKMTHFDGQHESEVLVKIGPFPTRPLRSTHENI